MKFILYLQISILLLLNCSAQDLGKVDEYLCLTYRPLSWCTNSFWNFAKEERVVAMLFRQASWSHQTFLLKEGENYTLLPLPTNRKIPREVPIASELGKKIEYILRKEISNAKTFGCKGMDGDLYLFAIKENGKWLSGDVWCPEEGTVPALMGKMVESLRGGESEGIKINDVEKYVADIFEFYKKDFRKPHTQDDIEFAQSTLKYIDERDEDKDTSAKITYEIEFLESTPLSVNVNLENPEEIFDVKINFGEYLKQIYVRIEYIDKAGKNIARSALCSCYGNRPVFYSFRYKKWT